MFFFFQAEDGIRDSSATGVQTCALPILIASLAAEIAAAKEAIKRLVLSLDEVKTRRLAPHLHGHIIDIRRTLRASLKARSEERRVGKEGRSRGSPYH